MRVDKMTLAALEATLNSYLDIRRAEAEIPTLRMLAADPALLRERAERLCGLLTAKGVSAEVIPEYDQVGGGSVPTQLLPTFAVAVKADGCTVVALEGHLRKQSRPIIGRIAKDRYLLDARTLWDEDLPYVAEQVAGGLQ